MVPDVSAAVHALAGQALLARSAGFGGTMPGMTAKVVLRGRNQGSQGNVDVSLFIN